MLVFHFSALPPEVLTKGHSSASHCPAHGSGGAELVSLQCHSGFPEHSPCWFPVGTVGKWVPGDLGNQVLCANEIIQTPQCPPWIWAFVHSLWTSLHRKLRAGLSLWRSCWPYSGTYRMFCLKGTCKITAFAHFRNTLDYFSHAGYLLCVFPVLESKEGSWQGRENRLAAVLF